MPVHWKQDRVSLRLVRYLPQTHGLLLIRNPSAEWTEQMCMSGLLKTTTPTVTARSRTLASRVRVQCVTNWAISCSYMVDNCLCKSCTSIDQIIGKLIMTENILTCNIIIIGVPKLCLYKTLFVTLLLNNSAVSTNYVWSCNSKIPVSIQFFCCWQCTYQVFIISYLMIT